MDEELKNKINLEVTDKEDKFIITSLLEKKKKYQYWEGY